MKVYQIIAEDPQVLMTLDPRGNYQVQMDNGSIKTFPDKATADAWVKDPKNIAQSNWDKHKATPQIDPKTGKPIPGLKAPTEKQRKKWNKTTPEQGRKARAKLEQVVLTKKAPWADVGWKPKGVTGWAVALLNLAGAATLAYSWWKQVEQLKAHAKNEHPDDQLAQFQADNMTDAGEYDLQKVNADQIYSAIDSSTLTEKAKEQWSRECQEYSKVIATEAAVVAATFIISVRSQQAISSRLVKILQVGMAAGGVGTAIFAGTVGGVPAGIVAGTMLFGAVSIDLLSGAMAALLATDTGKKFITETLLWAMGALGEQAGQGFDQGIEFIKKGVEKDQKAGPARQQTTPSATKPAQTTPPPELSADDVRKQLGIN